MQFQDLEIRYGNRKILSDLNLSIEPGDFVFVIGPSGSGKTSFIRTLVGELAPKKGKIITDDGKDLYAMSAKDLSLFRRKIGVVFQDFKLLESRTVRENVAFAMEVSGYPDKLIERRIPEVLTDVNMLSKRDSFIPNLSGGEAQRIGIARALIHNPDIIIGDEPTGNLDPENAKEIMHIFERLNREGKTIIISTHDSSLVDQMKKRVIAFE
ncbi:MAG: cell division ATP-binding protein FtsE [Patescibacteria group bacterium]